MVRWLFPAVLLRRCRAVRCLHRCQCRSHTIMRLRYLLNMHLRRLRFHRALSWRLPLPRLRFRCRLRHQFRRVMRFRCLSMICHRPVLRLIRSAGKCQPFRRSSDVSLAGTLKQLTAAVQTAVVFFYVCSAGTRGCGLESAAGGLLAFRVIRCCLRERLSAAREAMASAIPISTSHSPRNSMKIT